MIDSTNMTHAEHFRMNGTLSEARCLELIDLSEQAPIYKDAITKIGEAIGQFPAEDFTSDISDRLHNIAKRLRGNSKSNLLSVIEALDDLTQCTFYATEYGRSELHGALKILEGVPDDERNATKKRV